MLRGQLYRAGDAQLTRERLHCRTLLQRFNGIGPEERDQRLAILAELLGEIGSGAMIQPPFYCDYGYLIRVGPGTFINYGAIFLDCGPITVGADVQIGPGVQLLAATHPLEAAPRRDSLELSMPITLGDGAWLGGGVIVCPGASIGENSVVGAGSVVTRDIPAGVLAVGNPCRVVRDL